MSWWFIRVIHASNIVHELINNNDQNNNYKILKLLQGPILLSLSNNNIFILGNNNIFICYDKSYYEPTELVCNCIPYSSYSF